MYRIFSNIINCFKAPIRACLCEFQKVGPSHNLVHFLNSFWIWLMDRRLRKEANKISRISIKKEGMKNFFLNGLCPVWFSINLVYKRALPIKCLVPAWNRFSSLVMIVWSISHQVLPFHFDMIPLVCAQLCTFSAILRYGNVIYAFVSDWAFKNSKLYTFVISLGDTRQFLATKFVC